ncbi:MAG TPA: STAS domain-containing protein [Actinomycetota bacterium]|nr:STAS domain-containing protein [Actinomycetota bacterium]
MTGQAFDARNGPAFRAEVRRDGRSAEVALVGEIDAATSSMLRDAVVPPLGGGWVDLDLDMAEVTFVDSQGLRVLIEVARSARGTLTLHDVRPAVQRLFDLTGVASALPNLALA